MNASFDALPGLVGLPPRELLYAYTHRKDFWKLKHRNAVNATNLLYKLYRYRGVSWKIMIAKKIEKKKKELKNCSLNLITNLRIVENNTSVLIDHHIPLEKKPRAFSLI